MRANDIVPTILRSLSEGRVLRRATATALRVVAALAVVGALVDVVLILRLSFGADDAAATIAGVLLALGVAACGLVASQVAWFRAGSVEALPESQHPMLAIASVLLRTTGEIVAACFLTLGLFAAVASWIAPRFAGYAMAWVPVGVPGASFTSGFLGGIAILLACAFTAAIALAVAYLLAESVVVLADIARDVRALSGGVEPIARMEMPPPPPPPPPPPDEPDEPMIDPDRTHVMGSVSASTCAQCGSVVLPGARSCRRCGSPI